MAQFDFSKIYADHKETVWKLISRYVASQQDREDLFQEVFLKIYKALPNFREESEISTWIFRITVNIAINFLKKQKRYATLKEILNRLKLVEIQDKQEISDDSLLKPLEKLNPQQRAILIMADVEERKLDEIAKIFNIPVGTIKSNLHRAREIIKKELNNNDKL